MHCAKRLAVTICLGCAIPVAAQELLDRVLASVNDQAVTLSDARAAVGLGFVELRPGEDTTSGALRGLIDRQLMLAEVSRFPPPEPDPQAVSREVARFERHTGSAAQLDALMRATGLNRQRLTELARDSLRIDSYLAQRFGETVQATDEDAAQYYRTHAEEFRRNGAPVPFEEAAPMARQRASDDRRRATIDQWVRDLRRRANISCQLPAAGCQ